MNKEVKKIFIVLFLYNIDFLYIFVYYSMLFLNHCKTEYSTNGNINKLKL